MLRAVWLFKQAGKSFRRLEESASTLNLAAHIAEEAETIQVKTPLIHIQGYIYAKSAKMYLCLGKKIKSEGAVEKEGRKMEKIAFITG